MKSLKSIEVDPNNWKYSIYNDKLIIGKSTKEQENFDILVFCVRDVKTVEIPDFIKIIGPFAFDCSDIKYLSIPKGVTKISTSSFSSCENLQKIEIPEDSKLETIEGKAFSWASIESLTFPSNLIDLKEKWCYSSNITNIKVDQKNQFFSTYDDGKLIIGKSSKLNEEYDHLVFCMRNIKSVKIPSFIRVIKSFAFYECENLKKVEIPANSELQIIEKYALSCVSIDKFTISPHLIIIGEYAFSSCNKLRKIEIQKDPQLQIISK